MKPTDSSGTDVILVLCACGSEAEARHIAEKLVASRLAACVNVMPSMQSVYRWKEVVERAQEWLLTIKSTAELFDAIEEMIGDSHSYEVPEIIAVPVVAGSSPYLGWLREQVSQP